MRSDEIASRTTSSISQLRATEDGEESSAAEADRPVVQKADKDPAEIGAVTRDGLGQDPTGHNPTGQDPTGQDPTGHAASSLM